MVSTNDFLQDRGQPARFGVANLNPDQRFTSLDPGYISMLGGEEADYLGQHWVASVDPAEVERVHEAFQQARRDGRGYAEIHALHDDSRIAYQALNITRLDDSQGTFLGYQCLRHDISCYNRDQEVLMLAVESAPNGLLIIDASGEIKWANQAVEKLFEYQRSELIGRQVEMLLPERYRSLHLQYRESFSQNQQTTAMKGRDLSGLRSDGVEIPLQLYLNRLGTLNGEVILCTIIDIGQHVLYETQLEEARKAAEVANQAKSDFLARMSHEIRTPMNLIMGMNTLLLESPLNDTQRQRLEISSRNVRRMLRLINGILDLSKVEAGMLKLAASPFNLVEVMRESAATMADAIEGKGLEFKLNLDPDAWPFLIGDEERLQQVLMNLMGNAIKFTSHGHIEVSVDVLSDGPSGQELRFQVEDTGCGIPPAQRTLIFEAFQQAEGSIGRTYEGTGLGLSIAKTLVELMSGRIWVDPNYFPGSKFVFTALFPRSTEQAWLDRQSSAVSPEAVQSLENGTRILLVEDNPENLLLLRAYLESLPLSLEAASNGLEALRKRQAGKYDLIFMDIQMPVMDGYTAAREIRAWEEAHRHPRVPIVALTAHAITGASAESFKSGCDGHITKPIERHDLVGAIVSFAKREVQAPVPAVPPAIAARRPAFWANRQNDLIKMRDALAAEDFATIQSIGHNCKGTGNGYGFPDVTRLGAAVEEAARAKDRIQVERRIGEMEKSLAATAP